MNTIKSRFERFAAFAFSSSSSFEKGADLWDAISHYEFYLTDGEPNETFVNRLEELGCSRRWLLYASGEMFADNEPGRVLRYKFMQGIGISNKRPSFDNSFSPYQSESANTGQLIEEKIQIKKKSAVTKKAAVKVKRTAKKK